MCGSDFHGELQPLVLAVIPRKMQACMEQVCGRPNLFQQRVEFTVEMTSTGKQREDNKLQETNTTQTKTASQAAEQKNRLSWTTPARSAAKSYQVDENWGVGQRYIRMCALISGRRMAVCLGPDGTYVSGSSNPKHLSYNY